MLINVNVAASSPQLDLTHRLTGTARGYGTQALWASSVANLRAATAQCDRANQSATIPPFWPNFLANTLIVWLALSLPVLIIGLVVRWVARGFKRPPQ